MTLSSSLETKVTINFGFINLTIPFVKSLWLIRFVLIITIIGCILYPLFRDYTPYFPKNYKLTVSYSNNDIQNALSELSQEEMKKFKIKKVWLKEKEKIWETIVTDITDKMNENISTKHVSMTAVDGHTYFSIKKTGFLRYDLEDSYGNLDHQLQLPSAKPIKVFTRFELAKRERFDVTFNDIFFRRGIIVAGKFKQYLYSINELMYLFDILAITKVKFLPVICIGKTIYLYKNKQEQMIPIGMAINLPIERD